MLKYYNIFNGMECLLFFILIFLSIDSKFIHIIHFNCHKNCLNCEPQKNLRAKLDEPSLKKILLSA